MAIDIAGQQILAQPVSGFLQGRALRRAEEEGSRRMKALEAAEGREQAREAREQELFDESARMRNTQVLYRAFSQIESSDDPEAMANTLSKSPEISEIFGRMGKDPTEGFRGKSADEIRAAAKEGRMQLEPFLPKEKASAESKEGKIMMDVKKGFLTKEQGDAALKGKSTTPNSYDEFVLAQKDPDFAKFLKERRGKGLSMTLPDGTVIEMGGPASGVGPDELSKPTINNLQETILNSTNRLDRLNQTLKTYNPEFLRAKGLLTAASTKVKDFVGIDVTKEQREFLAQYSEFQANAAQDFNQTLKELSGVAVNAHELERAMQAAPSGKDISPIEFEAKARATTKFVTRAIMRANWALKNGIGVKSVDQLAKVMPLEGIDAEYEKRANEIWQELGGKPENKAEAIKKANEEFGLARKELGLGR